MTRSRRLDAPLKCYRIGDPRGEHPIWDSGGAYKVSGRWHEAGAGVIYTSEHYSTAMLEKLVHFSGEMPPHQHFIEISVPAGVSYEVVNPDLVPGWSAPNGRASRQFARKWYEDLRSAILIVPSVVARMERNFVVHTGHADFPRISIGLETPIWWDERLFAL